MSLGLTNGTNNGTLYNYGNNKSQYGVIAGSGNNLAIGTYFGAGGMFPLNRAIGVMSDPSQSGLVTNFSDLNIGGVNSIKLGKYILKY